MMDQKIDVKKIIEVVKTVFTWIVVAFAVCIMIFTLVSVNTFDKNERNLFGFKFFVVQTDSMAKTDFKAGDIVIAKEVKDLRELKAGDIITFISESSHNYGETVTHKIREVTKDADGSIAFVTYGTTTDTVDEALATIVVGKYVGNIPNLGAFFLFLKTTPGYIICILIPFLILIISQGINCIQLFRRYKQEQTAELEAERAKIEEERAQSQRMMAELLELKRQLAGQSVAPAPTPAVTVAAAPVDQAPAVTVAPATPVAEAPIAPAPTETPAVAPAVEAAPETPTEPVAPVVEAPAEPTPATEEIDSAE